MASPSSSITEAPRVYVSRVHTAVVHRRSVESPCITSSFAMHCKPLQLCSIPCILLQSQLSIPIQRCFQRTKIVLHYSSQPLV